MAKWYDNYLHSDHWQRLRIERMLQCELSDMPQSIRCEHRDCGLFVPLNVIQVHHLTYDNLGHESMEDLAVYCSSCHGASHGFMRPVWWTAAKSQGLRYVTQDHYRNYRRIKRAGEVMFECLQFTPQGQMRLLLDQVKMGVEVDSAKYTAKAT